MSLPNALFAVVAAIGISGGAPDLRDPRPTANDPAPRTLGTRETGTLERTVAGGWTGSGPRGRASESLADRGGAGSGCGSGGGGAITSIGEGGSGCGSGLI